MLPIGPPAPQLYFGWTPVLDSNGQPWRGEEENAITRRKRKTREEWTAPPDEGRGLPTNVPWRPADPQGPTQTQG